MTGVVLAVAIHLIVPLLFVRVLWKGGFKSKVAVF